MTNESSIDDYVQSPNILPNKNFTLNYLSIDNHLHSLKTGPQDNKQLVELVKFIQLSNIISLASGLFLVIATIIILVMVRSNVVPKVRQNAMVFRSVQQTVLDMFSPSKEQFVAEFTRQVTLLPNIFV